MKRLKALLSFLAISLGLATMPLGATTSVVNVPVVHGAWTFIGVPGFQAFGASSGTSSAAWGSATTRIVDAANTRGGIDYQVSGLEVPTWDGNVSDKVTTSTASALNDGSTPRQPNLGGGVGSNQYGTVAVMALGQDVADVGSSDTDHNGAVIVALEWSAVVKNYESPIRTMYIESVDAEAPDIKILYQANQEGESFKIQYETGTASTLTTTDNTTYQGTFDKDYTYDNAAVLGSDFVAVSATTSGATSGNDVTGVLASFDMDISDNNMTSNKNDIEPNTAYTSFNGVSYTNSLRGTLDGNMTVLGWDSATQQWRQFRATGESSTNTVTVNSASDFTSFEQGHGYWVKVDRDGGLLATNPSAFVLGYDAAADINHTTFIADGWNMLSFGDEYLSYSVTGATLAIAGVEDLNISDTYGATTLSFTSLAGTETPEVACATINQGIDLNNSLAFTNVNIRCIPSGAGTSVTLLSTRRFTITPGGGVVPTRLNGTALSAEGNGTIANFYKTQYGDYGLVIEPNTDFFTGTTADGNISIEFPVNTVGEYYANINGTPADNGAVTIATAMGSASSGLTSAANAVTELDMTFDGTSDALLLGSNYRFFVKDATIIRTFDYDNTLADTNTTIGTSNEENNVSIRIIGKANADTNITDDNLPQTVSDITGHSGSTRVSSVVIKQDTNDTFMIYYTGLYEAATARAGKIDLQEWGESWDLLTETDTSTESNTTVKGAIAKVWDISTIADYTEDMNASGAYDGNYSSTTASAISADVSDLKYIAVYAENFPITGPLYDITTSYGKKAELIITGQTEATTGSFISWKQIDVSKEPTEWYDSDDQFELFWTEKEKGYWVYLDGASTNDLNINTPTISGTPYAHFNNLFSGTSTSANTRNHLNHTLSVEIDNLTDLGANADTDAFEVYATVGGVMTSFQRTGATNTFTVPLDSHETSGVTFDAGELTVTITASEGSGKTTSYSYTLDYEKPVITGTTLSGSTATVTITDGDATALHIYSGDVNDSNYGTSSATNWAGSVTVTTGTADTTIDLAAISITSSGTTTYPFEFASAFENNTTAYLDSTTYDSLAEQIDEGVIRDVRFTAKDSMDLYSDQERLYYVPIYSNTGILTSTGTTTYDSAPAVYTRAGDLNDTWSGNDGVQLKDSGSTLSCVYAHNDSKLEEGTANTMDIETSSGTVLGTIMYMDAYIGQPLVCQTGSSTYVGGFVDQNDGTHPNSIVVQPFSSQVSVTIAKVKP